MATLPREDYLKIHDTAAGLAQNGLTIFRWEPSKRYPRYEWANDVVVARTKMDRAELLGEEPTFLSIGSNAYLADIAREHIDSGDETPFEVELTVRDGSTFWLECVVRALEPAPNGALRFVCASHTIDRRKAYQRLSRLMSAMADNAPAGIFIVRLLGADLLSPPVVYTNPTFWRMTGYTQYELEAGVYPRILGGRENGRLVRGYVEAVLRGESVVTDLQLRRKDGTPFWCEVRAHPLETPTVHCAVVLLDTTARREAQDAMSLLTEGVAQASDFMIVTDETTPSQGGPKILTVNRSFLEGTGYDEPELIGAPYTIIYSPHNPPSVMGAIRNAIETEQPNYREVLARRKDGSEFWIEFVDRPFVTRHGRRLRLMVGRDITLRRSSTNQLSLLFAATEQAETPVIIYDADENGELAVSYENDAALGRHYYHLQELWTRGDTEGRSTRQQLERGERAHVTYTHIDANGSVELVQMLARPIRNESRLEAILTYERVLSAKGAAADDGAHTRLIDLAMMLPALDRAKGLPERIEALRALLHNGFGASIEMQPFSANGDVHIDQERRVAVFARNGTSAQVTWPKPLEPLAVTALRFAIEAALEGV
jgi:PAS domain S-box-containing protein